MKYIKIISIISLTLLVLFSASTLHAQNDEQGGILKTDNGILIVWNEPNNNYTIEIKGNDIRPVPDRPFLFFVDGKFLQMKTVAKKDFLKKAQMKDLDDKAILTAHRDWEAQYLGGVFKQTLKIDSLWQKLTNGMDALWWNFEMPRNEKGQAKKQVYLIISKGDHILLLNSAVTDKVDEGTAQQFLLDTMATLKINKKPLSLKKAQEQIMKGDN
jgi:hypothetical protein